MTTLAQLQTLHEHQPGWEATWNRLATQLYFGLRERVLIVRDGMEQGLKPPFRQIFRNDLATGQDFVSYLFELFHEKARSRRLLVGFPFDGDAPSDPVRWLLGAGFLRLRATSFAARSAARQLALTPEDVESPPPPDGDSDGDSETGPTVDLRRLAPRFPHPHRLARHLVHGATQLEPRLDPELPDLGAVRDQVLSAIAPMDGASAEQRLRRAHAVALQRIADALDKIAVWCSAHPGAGRAARARIERRQVALAFEQCFMPIDASGIAELQGIAHGAVYQHRRRYRQALPALFPDMTGLADYLEEDADDE